MSLSKQAKEAGINVEPVSTEAPAVEPAEVSTEATATEGVAEKKKGKDSEAHARFVGIGKSVRAQMSDDEKAKEGSHTDDVSFICALGNPKKKAKRKEGGKDLASWAVVGYGFKANADIKVPRANLKKGCKSEMDVEPITWEDVKAGEVFYLNRYETGVLITQLDYAGTFTGGDMPVRFQPKFSNDRTMPLPTLNLIANKGSVKENIELIGDAQTNTLKPEFEEKFHEFFATRTASRKGASKKTDKADKVKDLAAAFRKFAKENEA